MSKSDRPVKRRNEGKLFVSLQQRFRRARFAKIESMIENELEDGQTLRILDVGGRAEYWNMLASHLRERVHVTLLNYGGELDVYSKSVEEGLNFENAAGDACDMPQYGDQSFDLVHSNSVIEHVGSYANMLNFARELRRVGKAYYVQTPNFWFPIDPHTAIPMLHWLPDSTRMFAHTHFTLGLAKKGNADGALKRMDECRMVSRRMMRAFFPDAEHSNERFGLIFAKSLIAIRER